MVLTCAIRRAGSRAKMLEESVDTVENAGHADVEPVDNSLACIEGLEPHCYSPARSRYAQRQ